MRRLGAIGKLLLTLLGLVLAAGAVSAALSPPRGGRPLAERLNVPYRAVIAHRGASALAPESTVPAYLLAREMGVDYLEADLQRTADGVIVVFHDDTLADKTNVAQVFPGRENDPIDTFTYEELQQLDAGSWFNTAYPDRARPSFAGLRILTLEELIAIALADEDGPGLYLETKSAHRHGGYEEEIVRVLREAGLIDANGNPAGAAEGRARVVFQSFYPESLAALQRLAPGVPRVLLGSSEIEAEQGWSRVLGTASAQAHGVGPIGYLAWPWNVGAAHRAGLIVHPYVINVPWQMRLLSYFGADGIFTDAPHIALPVYAGKEAPDVEALFRAIGY